jgi:hypothetical protein
MFFLSSLGMPTLNTFLDGAIFPNYFAQAVALLPKFSGSANALFSSLAFLVSGMTSSLGTVRRFINNG